MDDDVECSDGEVKELESNTEVSGTISTEEVVEELADEHCRY